MKREPNPYSKNPMLTVTSTMSISVPSMVAEDVLNGTDAPVITTDPEVHGRIDAVSEVVDLMDTRIDAVSNMSELLYGSCISTIGTVSGALELMDTRIDAVSEAVDLMDTRIDAVSNMSELLYGSCVSADELLNDRIDAVSGAIDLMDTRIDGVSNMLALNGSGSSSGSSAPAVTVEDSDSFEAKRLVLSRLGDSRSSAAYGDAIRNYRLTAPGTQPSDTTAITYALQTFLAATGIHETVGKYANQAAQTRIALVEGVSQSSTPQFMWWDSGAYKYKKWEPWKEAGSSSSGSTTQSDEITLDSYHLDELMFSYEDGFLYPSAQGVSESMLNYCSGISCCYFRDPSGSPWIHHAEMRFTKNTGTDDVEIQLRRDNSHDWITVASTAGTSSSGSSSDSSGSAAGVYELVVLDNGTDVGSRMAPLVSEKSISDGTYLDVLNWSIGDSASNAKETSGMYTLIGNPIALYDSAYRSPQDSRIKGAVRVVDMHGKICWQRYSYTAKQWMIEENPSFYWQETNKFSTSIVAVLSYPGYSDKDAVLIDNPLYAGQYNSRPCAVRPYISSDGTLLYWKRRTESGGWTDVKASGTSGTTASTTALCSYATILADRNAETADAVRKGITFGYHAGGDTTTLGYLQFADTLNSANDYKSIIAIEDLLWLGDNINKLKALVN